MSEETFTQEDVDRVRAIAFACECEDSGARSATWARWLDTLADRLSRTISPAAARASADDIARHGSIAAEDAMKASPHRFPTTL